MYLLDGRNRDPEAVRDRPRRLRDARRRQRAPASVRSRTCAERRARRRCRRGRGGARPWPSSTRLPRSRASRRSASASRPAWSGAGVRATSRSRSTTAPTRSRRPRASRRSTRSGWHATFFMLGDDGAPRARARRRGRGRRARGRRARRSSTATCSGGCPATARDDIRRCRDTRRRLRRRRARVVPPAVRRSCRTARCAAHATPASRRCCGRRGGATGGGRRRPRRSSPTCCAATSTAARCCCTTPTASPTPGRWRATVGALPLPRRASSPAAACRPVQLGDHGLPSRRRTRRRRPPRPARRRRRRELGAAGVEWLAIVLAVAGGLTYASRGRPAAARRRGAAARALAVSAAARRPRPPAALAARQRSSTSPRTCLEAAALGVGSVVIVGPLLVSGLLFAIPLADLRDRRARRRGARWCPRSLVTARARGVRRGRVARGRRVAGVDAGWVDRRLVRRPSSVGSTDLASGGARSAGAGRLLLGIATGTLYGLTSVLTKSTVDLFDNGDRPDLHALAAIRARCVLDRGADPEPERVPGRPRRRVAAGDLGRRTRSCACIVRRDAVRRDARCAIPRRAGRSPSSRSCAMVSAPFASSTSPLVTHEPKRRRPGVGARRGSLTS